MEAEALQGSKSGVKPLLLKGRPWIFLAAYDVSPGETSEGYVAFNILRRLVSSYRVVLLTRRNNRDRIITHPDFLEACKGVWVVGFDLPRWASWWKRGARFYGLYAYLWQMVWPLELSRRSRLCKGVRLIHVLNFHNDSIPTSAWAMSKPIVWGPVNHHELVSSWRRESWPIAPAFKHRALFFLRCLLWRVDPFLWLSKQMAAVILSAGPWVDRRLGIDGSGKVLRLSQLGVDATDFPIPSACIQLQQSSDEKLLIYAGRLDWLKGVDLAIEALAHLPMNFRLMVVGKGPAAKKLKSLVEQLNLSDRVVFRPPVSRTELARLYAGADMFLFTSPEVAGLAWIEALACGLPVAGFAGNTELALSGGKLPGVYLAHPADVRAGHIRQYAKVIAHAAYLQHDRNEISTAVLSRYSWDRMVNIIDASYKKACGDLR
jgi:glycosyltransferase involved in cell wall biosynthesis